MNKKTLTVIALFLVLVCAVGVMNYTNPFNTDELRSWCSSGETIRMIGGEYYNETAVIDDSGNIWEIDCENKLKENDFYLLWIADNGTDGNVKDDKIVKIWKEVY